MWKIAVTVLVGLTLVGAARADDGPDAFAACKADYAQGMRAQDADAPAKFQTCIAAVREAQRKAACLSTQASRIGEAQKEAREWLAWLNKVLPVAKSVNHSCGYVTRNVPGQTEFVRTGNSLVARPVQETTLVCRGGIPKGLTEEDVSRVLDIVAETHKAVTETGSTSTCADVDPVKLSIPRNDTEGLKALLAWKPSAP